MSTNAPDAPAARTHPGLSVQDHRLIRAFNKPGNASRRVSGEVLGTYLLVAAAAGADMVNTATRGGLGHTALVMAPGLMIIAVVLFLGPVSGAHLNPVVTLAFALRRDFPWRRVPGYVLAQATGAALASATLVSVFGHQGRDGMTAPGAPFSDLQAFTVEVLLTAGLVSTVLGVASGAQNVGALSAFGVAAYIVTAGLWGGPVSGASMNPARTSGPDLLAGDFSQFCIYTAAPVTGGLLAVAIARMLRGKGGNYAAEKAAQGSMPG
ncbi:MIP/aquaporin family protein [Arthrobacter liuii]|uniref:Major intrinsic protein n=1 Tax=Arthrobacter liuii TaxID=1476996 RepID=A0ABQ2B0J6_9MICC|nr:aquaporin [Arthrobacter liuii]GGI01356.1 major intrinsic protein [Arthrobacter liuii]